MPKHFGIDIREGKYGFKLARENYAIMSNKSSFRMVIKSCNYADEENGIYSDEWCEKHLKNCLDNFDLNMEFFSLLDHEEFNIELNNFIKDNECFTEISDLKLYDQKPGYYIMVLDDYCQVYIGTTDNIKKRIQQHWGKSKPFDRLLFPIGAVNTSILSIDCFRTLDTTRIFVYTTDNIFEKEDDITYKFPSKFVCNRLGGGKIDGGLLQAITMMKKRDLK